MKKIELNNTTKTLRTLSKRKLNKVLQLHKKWLNGEEDGKCANLSYMDLTGADLSGVDLSYAKIHNTILTNANLSYSIFNYVDFSYTNFFKANLEGVEMKYSNLKGVDFLGAFLRGVDFYQADLSFATINGANLEGTNLIEANLKTIHYDSCTAFFTLQCPEKGKFIGYQKIKDKVVELLILEDSKRSSATTRVCRASKVRVLSITDTDGNDSGLMEILDNKDNITYRIGGIIEIEDFDDNRWKEYGKGICFYITRDEAIIN